MNDKSKMIFEAVETLYDSEDNGSIDPAILKRRITVIVESVWQDGMSLEGLIQASRRKFNAPQGGSDDQP